MAQANTAAPAITGATPAPSVESIDKLQKNDHWFVQVVGGMTLANTIVSSLAIFYLFLEFGIA